MKVFYDEDVTTNVLEGKTIAVIGYGSQGRGQSLNMHDSGLNVVMGLREGGSSWKKAEADGLTVKTIEGEKYAERASCNQIGSCLIYRLFLNSVSKYL